MSMEGDVTMQAQPAGYQLIDHPADLGIEAYGQDLAEAFEQVAVGLMSVILDLDSVALKEPRQVVLEASDCEHLLVKWLTEILYLYDGTAFVPGQFQCRELRPTSLSATVLGEPFDICKHTTRLDVKAITYHQLFLEEGQSGARVRVFLDI
jgi:SHS2 domain-containing protein